MPTYGHPRRSVRIDEALWREALAAAERRGENVSDVIRRALERYVKAAAKGRR